jgi:hypothetical protein
MKLSLITIEVLKKLAARDTVENQSHDAVEAYKQGLDDGTTLLAQFVVENLQEETPDA